ncbi:MAG TPA: hypothetical protein VHT91_42235 [Kofleriaceae bacterium]|jgi:hypothetical protein|nr:hypothetical protein [Kofleriaceae bacterium]
MKKNPENKNPLRVRAETLRHLRRAELAAAGGGLTPMTDVPADCSTDGWTLHADPPPKAI